MQEAHIRERLCSLIKMEYAICNMNIVLKYLNNGIDIIFIKFFIFNTQNLNVCIIYIARSTHSYTFFDSNKNSLLFFESVFNPKPPRAGNRELIIDPKVPGIAKA